jgi:hypothetical protein
MKTITHNQYLQLVGLLAITTKHYAMIKQFEEAFVDITGEEDTAGHSMDILCGCRDLDEGLKLLHVTVTPAQRDHKPSGGA